MLIYSQKRFEKFMGKENIIFETNEVIFWVTFSYFVTKTFPFLCTRESFLKNVWNQRILYLSAFFENFSLICYLDFQLLFIHKSNFVTHNFRTYIFSKKKKMEKFKQTEDIEFKTNEVDFGVIST